MSTPAPDSLKAKLSLQEARARLVAPERREQMAPALAAAGLAAVSALALAGAVILGPPGMVSAQAASAPRAGLPPASAPAATPHVVALRPAG